MIKKKTLWEIPLGLALLVGMMVIPSGTAKAGDHFKDCRERIEHQEAKLQEAIRHHGERSRQAAKAREKLHDIRMKCDEHREHHH